MEDNKSDYDYPDREIADYLIKKFNISNGIRNRNLFYIYNVNQLLSSFIPFASKNSIYTDQI